MYGRRRRSYRRYYPRPRSRTRRYYGRRSGYTQMNDAETRSMSFTQNIEYLIEVPANKRGTIQQMDLSGIVSGAPTSTGGGQVTADSGRVFYAGMMYDRLRVKTISVSVRPKTMPAALGVPNYTFYMAWDRYASDVGSSEAANPRILTDDPSAKVVIWSPGGNPSPIYHRIYATEKDRYQYISIHHALATVPPPAANVVYWNFGTPGSVFFPILRFMLDLGVVPGTIVPATFVFQCRFTLEFMGSASWAPGCDTDVSASARLFPLRSPPEEEAVEETAQRMRALGRPPRSQLSPMMLPPAPRG